MPTKRKQKPHDQVQKSEQETISLKGAGQEITIKLTRKTMLAALALLLIGIVCMVSLNVVITKAGVDIYLKPVTDKTLGVERDLMKLKEVITKKDGKKR